MRKKQSEIPTVNFGLLGEENYVTAYIQVDNVVMRRIASSFPNETDRVIRAVAAYIAKQLEYPLDYRGRPTAARNTKVFKFWNGFYLTDETEDYGWLLPSQAHAVRKGICVDSSCLATTLLRIKNVQAWTVLGVILKTKTGKVLGFHAWTEAVKACGEHVVLETTVHPKPAQLIAAEKMYLGGLPVTYDPLAWFNESEYFEDKQKTRKYGEMFPYG
jgi:hypothetical protein